MAKVEIYTGDYCPYCQRAKALLRKKGVEFIEHDVSRNPEKRAEMQRRIPGARTIPQILINDKPIGGCDDLYALDRAGKLDELLKG